MNNQFESVQSIVQNHFPIQQYTIQSIKDCSKGCDNNVFLVTLASHVATQIEQPQEQQASSSSSMLLNIIVRIPRKLHHDDDKTVAEQNELQFPVMPMHRPCKQAWVLRLINEQCADLGLSVPKLIALDTVNDRYMIESYVPGIDMSDVELTPSQLQRVIFELGDVMRKLHSIRLKKFGYMSEEHDGVAQYDSWYQLFEPEFMNNVQLCHRSGFITHSVSEQLNDIWNDMKSYLQSFRDPCFVHSDLCSNNIRLTFADELNVNSENLAVCEREVHISGIIDFADLMSGDGLYDIGRFLSHMGGDWSVVQTLEQSYGSFDQSQVDAIRFYALYFCTWLLSLCKTETSILKYQTVLNKLLALYDRP